MKKNMPSTHAVTKLSSIDSHFPRIVGILLLAAGLLLNGCKDDDDDTSPDVSKLTGNYSVAETNMYDAVNNYSITISKSKAGGANIEISNFGDFMYKPVKGTISGNTLTIPSQSFTANTSTIKISGQGTLTGNKLHFDYYMESGGDVYDYSCEASKQ